VHPETTHFSGAIPRVEQVLDLIVLLVLLGASLRLARRWVQGDDLREHAGIIVTTSALCLVALGLRIVLFPPSFVHANFRGPWLVDGILAAPRPSEPLASYGQVSFLLLGTITRAVGEPRFETIAWTNAVVSVLSLAVVGVLAARWTGKLASLPLAVAVGALQPALARTGCSEDAHVLGAFFGLVALVAIDAYAARGDRTTLVLAIASAVLMVGSRQTYYAWAPCIVGMGIARGGRLLLRRPEMIVGTLVLGVALVLRLVTTAINEPAQVSMLSAALAGPGILWALLSRHPLFDLGRYALVLLPLEVLGVVAMRDPKVRRACLVFFLVTFVVTLPFGFSLPGVECSFRTPVLYLGVAFAASGAEFLWRWRPYGLAPIGLAIASPLVLPTWHELREVSPLTREYLFVRDVASPLLPRSFTLAEILATDPMPSYRLAPGALASNLAVTRKDVRALGPEDSESDPAFLLVGLQCRARSALELAGYTRKVETLPLVELRDVALRALRDEIPGGEVPGGMREECARQLVGAEPAGPELVIERAANENPFALYGPTPVSVRFWRLHAHPP
jgi:hypothetical protein